MTVFRSTAAVVALCGMLGLAVWTGGSTAAQAADPVAASPQPAADALKPGLSVRYWPYPMHSVNDVERLTGSGGDKGAPLPALNYDDSGNRVLTSGLKEEVGAEITGFIKFPQSGKYKIGAVSNDGVRVYIGGEKVTEDPGVHSMEDAPTAEINVEGDKWYPLRVIYFQRHGTWGLQLMWAPAGQELAVVPASALARTGD